MDNIKKIEKLIGEYIKYHKVQLIEYEKMKNKKAAYEDLLELLDSEYNEILKNENLILILLDSIYGDNIDLEEVKKILTQKNNITNLITFVYKDYNVLLEKFEIFTKKMEKEQRLEFSARRVKNDLKYHKLIDEKNDGIKNIIEIFNILREQEIINDQEYLLLTNEIIHYNEMKLLNNGNPEDVMLAKDSYDEIPNIALMGFQENEEIDVPFNIKGILDYYVETILKKITDVSSDEVIQIIETCIKEDIKDNEKNYIIVEIMNSYIEELVAIYRCLLDKDIYIDLESRNEIIRVYYKTLSKYTTIVNYYNKITECDYVEDELVDSLEFSKEQRLIYSRSEINVRKAKIISDMSDIRVEYYDEIYDLIIKFKNGTLGNKRIKAIKVGSKSQGHIELKSDSVRIILKRVRGNIYNVLGVLIKKANNDMNGYRIITNRNTPDVSTDELLMKQLELAEITERDIDDLVRQKGRKNGRK